MPRIWVKSLFKYFTLSLSLPLSVESFRKVIAKLHRVREQFQDRFVSLSNPNRGNEHHLLTIEWRDERRWKRIRNRCRLLAAANRAKNANGCSIELSLCEVRSSSVAHITCLESRARVQEKPEASIFNRARQPRPAIRCIRGAQFENRLHRRFTVWISISL